MNDYLEEEFKVPYAAWKAAPTPESNRAMLKTLEPLIQKGVTTFTGQTNPLLTSQARRLTLEGLRSYDPTRSRLQTHLYNQYKGLRRISRQQSQVISVPERVLFDQQRLRGYEQELTDQLGRAPSDRELADHSGFSMKRISHVRRYQAGIPEGSLESAAQGLTPQVRPSNQPQETWLQMVYDDLQPMDQKIMELSLGLHGRTALSNQEIARKLGRSPGAISQRKARIQQLLDQEQDLSPFFA